MPGPTRTLWRITTSIIWSSAEGPARCSDSDHVGRRNPRTRQLQALQKTLVDEPQKSPTRCPSWVSHGIPPQPIILIIGIKASTVLPSQGYLPQNAGSKHGSLAYRCHLEVYLRRYLVQWPFSEYGTRISVAIGAPTVAATAARHFRQLPRSGSHVPNITFPKDQGSLLACC